MDCNAVWPEHCDLQSRNGGFSLNWAESWAHYLHMADTIETAASFGISLAPKHPNGKAMAANPQKVSHPDASFDAILKNWLSLTYVLNSLNRGMGLPDLYPFVLSSPAIEKLRFIHETIAEAREQSGAGTRPDLPQKPRNSCFQLNSVQSGGC
jgi:hypothetical protein